MTIVTCSCGASIRITRTSPNSFEENWDTDAMLHCEEMRQAVAEKGTVSFSDLACTRMKEAVQIARRQKRL